LDCGPAERTATVPYIHVVFTLPHHLGHLALVNKKVFYDLLFHATAETLLQVAADPNHLGAQIGFFAVLHSWGQNLLFHHHIHCLIPAGGLSPDHTRWIHPRYPFFLPVGVLSRVFRGKFVAALKRRFQQRQLIFPRSLRPLQNQKAFRAFLRPLFRQNWVVYAKPPFGVPIMSLAISPVTRTASPSPTTASWPSMASRLPFAGRIMPRATRRE
jgi:Putative transposase